MTQFVSRPMAHLKTIMRKYPETGKSEPCLNARRGINHCTSSNRYRFPPLLNGWTQKVSPLAVQEVPQLPLGAEGNFSRGKMRFFPGRNPSGRQRIAHSIRRVPPCSAPRTAGILRTADFAWR